MTGCPLRRPAQAAAGAGLPPLGTSSYDANNRIQASPGGLTYTFDADGNVATRSDGVSYTFDTLNRLRAWSDGATSASYPLMR